MEPASAAATVGDLTCIASVLPWPLAANLWTWAPGNHGQRMRNTVDQLRHSIAAENAIWGGDSNQPLVGNSSGFTNEAETSSRPQSACTDFECPPVGMNRDGLYKALSADGNPTWSTILKVTTALGLRFELHSAAS